MDPVAVLTSVHVPAAVTVRISAVPADAKATDAQARVQMAARATGVPARVRMATVVRHAVKATGATISSCQ